MLSFEVFVVHAHPAARTFVFVDSAAAGLLVREHCPLFARAMVLQMEQGANARL